MSKGFFLDTLFNTPVEFIKGLIPTQVRESFAQCKTRPKNHLFPLSLALPNFTDQFHWDPYQYAILKEHLMRGTMLLLLLMLTAPSVGQDPATENLDLNELSEKFLQNLKLGQDTQEVREKLAHLTMDELENGLDSDKKRFAFWINVYNGYIIEILTKNPERYRDKKKFFKSEQIPVAGERISFEKIEHGLLRKSQWPLGMGYVRKWFPDSFERTMRVAQRDFRVHFALNCGAKDCPPVAIYTPLHLDGQLANATKHFLKKTTSYDPGSNKATITPLFQWFRGDFGGKKGILKLLIKQEILPNTRGIRIHYGNYDWSLDLSNWTNPGK